MGTHADILIVGGGVIGLTTALFLRKSGRTVTVLERGDCGQESSWAGAGILPPPPTTPHSPLEQLAALSDRLHVELHDELRTTTAIDNGYVRCGGHDLLEAEELYHVEQWQACGLHFEEIPRANLTQFEPLLDPGSARVFYFPQKAQLRNPRHVKALITWLARQGVTLTTHCPVAGWVVAQGRIQGVRTATGVLSADQYLLACGAWTDPLLEPLGWHPGIHPVRGQIALLQQQQPGFTRILEAGKHYLVPRPDGRVLVGSTEEHVGFVKKNTAGAIHDLLAFAYRLVPALRDAVLERCWAGLRPGNVDGLPLIGTVPGFDNLFIGAGHYRAGIQYSTGTALLLTALLQGRQPELDLEPFRLDRATLPQPAFRA